MSLIQLFKKLQNLLHKDGINYVDALQDICYLIYIKQLEPNITDTYSPGKIDLLNPYYYNPESLELIPFIPFSKWVEINEYELFEFVQDIFIDILGVHPITSPIYNNKYLSCKKQTTLKIMIEAINNFNFNKNIGQEFEEYIEKLTLDKVQGHYFTNRNIINLILDEINIKPNSTIYDPCCGSGGFLIESWKRNPSLILHGSDNNYDLVLFSTVNILLQTGTIINKNNSLIITRNDSILNQDLQKYDYILTNPFSLRVKLPDLKKSYCKDIFDSLFPIPRNSSVDLLQQCLLHKMNHYLVMIIPFGNELYGKQHNQINIRKKLLNTFNLKKIIFLPGGCFIYSSIQTCVMIWKPLKNKYKNTPCISFCKYNKTSKKIFPVKNVLYEELISEDYSLNIKDYTRIHRTFSNNVEVKLLQDLCEIKSAQPLKKSNIIPGKYPVIGGGKSPIGYHNDYNTDENTILISASGTAGFVSMYSEKSWISGCFAIISNDINNTYLYYYLKFIQDDIYTYCTGSTRPHISKETIKKLKIVVPSEKTQEKLEYFFTIINNKISLLEKYLIDNDEFINNCIDIKLSFNSVNTFLLKDIAIITKGSPLNKKNITFGQYPVIGGGQKPIGYHNNYNTDENTILISASGSAGYVGYYSNKTFITNHCYKIKPIKIDNKFLYYYLKFIQNDIYEYRTGPAQPNLNLNELENLKINVPSEKIQNEIINEIDYNNKLFKEKNLLINKKKNMINDMIKDII